MGDGGVRWNPWRSLRDRPHVRFRLDRLPPGVEGASGRTPDRSAILVSSELTRRQRNAVLAHELVHDERGGGPGYPGNPPGWQAIVHRDERAVDREVARRLVPRDELAAFCERRLELGEPTFPRDVEEEFDVPRDVAELALLQLRGAA